MQKIERTIVIEGGDPQAIWDYVSDFTTTEEWDPPTQTTERLSGDGGVGTVYRNVSKFLGSETEVTYTVVAHEPPHRLELDGETSSVKLHDEITVEQEGTDVRVHYRAEFHPHGVAKLAEPVLPLALKKIGDDAAEQLELCLRKLG
ncbi:SRPBCC family protein [Nocardioides sp. MH1]|uniref:SRPBCC family protein n=1 Tax=Nocardioides sp. MH1 TaxID=3242490 RepID=UPI003522AFDA